jgi:hypothetical protein
MVLFFFFCSTFSRSARLICGRTPPKAMVARMRESSSSSPRMASWRWRGVIRLTLRSLAAFYSPRYISTAQTGQIWWEMTHSCELENFRGEVFEDSGNVDGCLRSNAHFVLGIVLQETLDTTARELDRKYRQHVTRSRHCSVSHALRHSPKLCAL